MIQILHTIDGKMIKQKPNLTRRMIVTENIDEIKKSVHKAMRIEAITNTFSEMLEKHPEQEELLVKMLKAKLEALD